MTERQFKVLFAAVTALALLIVGATIYVVLHFLMKFW